MKSVSFPKSQITSKTYCQGISLVFEKGTVPGPILEFKESVRHVPKRASYLGNTK